MYQTYAESTLPDTKSVQLFVPCCVAICAAEVAMNCASDVPVLLVPRFSSSTITIAATRLLLQLGVNIQVLLVLFDLASSNRITSIFD